MSNELKKLFFHLKENINEVQDEEYAENDLGESLEEAKYIGRVLCLNDIADYLAAVPEFEQYLKERP